MGHKMALLGQGPSPITSALYPAARAALPSNGAIARADNPDSGTSPALQAIQLKEPAGPALRAGREMPCPASWAENALLAGPLSGLGLVVEA